MNDLLRAIKPAVFVGSSRKDLQSFPRKVRQESVRPFLKRNWEIIQQAPNPLEVSGAALEIRDNFESGTYRAVYTVRFEGVLYVLHAFQKKSTNGIATPQRHLDLLRRRLREAETLHKAMKGDRT